LGKVQPSDGTVVGAIVHGSRNWKYLGTARNHIKPSHSKKVGHQKNQKNLRDSSSNKLGSLGSHHQPSQLSQTEGQLSLLNSGDKVVGDGENSKLRVGDTVIVKNLGHIFQFIRHQ